ncbi:MAG: TetR/AcrR family transcriptional regulator [Hyphomonas sp.]|nr:TetR/AcrR family transcriptional regulator [Hyphomonas sp.]
MKRARTDEAKEDRRAALLKAALDTFYEHGFRAARMDDIARRAGVSKGAVYLYFDSKDALFEALIEDLATPNIERAEAIMRSAPSFDMAVTQFAAFAPYMLQETDLPKLMKILVGDSQFFPDVISNYRRNNLERLIGALKTLLTEAHARGEIDAPDADLTARLIVAPMAFAGMWQAVFGRDPEAAMDLPALFALHAANIRKALRPEAPE